MLVRKITAAKLEVGKVYVAFSAKSKMLSSNGDKGVFVLVESVTGKDVKVNILSSARSMTIKNIDERPDAWIYAPDDTLKVFVNAEGKRDKFPKFTDRMFDAFQASELVFSAANIYKHEREGEWNGQTFYRFRGDDGKTNTFNFAWIAPNVVPEWRIPRAQRMGVGAVEVKLPPKPVSAEELALIEKLSVAIEKFNKGKNLDRTASYIVLNEDLKVIDGSFSAACHYSLRQNTGGKFVISGCKAAKAGGLTEDELKTYITYLTNDSPFADAFLVKSCDWIYENGYILTGDVTATLLAGACIATRQAWEYPQFVKAFNALLEQGVSPRAAHIFGSYAVTDGGDKWGFGAGSSGHGVFNLISMDDESIIRFLDANPKNVNKKPYHQDSAYRGIHAMWGGGEASAVWAKLRNMTGAGKYGTSVKVPKEEAMEMAADIIEEWMKAEGV